MLRASGPFASRVSKRRDAHPNLDFRVGDARDLPFHGEFDLVVSFSALHWVPEQERALRSISAALKPAGMARLRLVAERNASES